MCVCVCTIYIMKFASFQKKFRNHRKGADKVRIIIVLRVSNFFSFLSFLAILFVMQNFNYREE